MQGNKIASGWNTWHGVHNKPAVPVFLGILRPISFDPPILTFNGHCCPCRLLSGQDTLSH